MSKTYVYADPHFFHAGCCRFLRKDGSKLRPWTDPDVMGEDMIELYNDTVGDNDRVYFLGDVAMNRKALDRSLPRLRGRKVLVKGNHDIDKLSYYSQYFDDIRACVVKKGFIMTHIPIHEASMSRWSLNIHGHLHDGTVKDMFAGHQLQSNDKRYRCVSVEHTDYKPIDLDVVLKEAGLK